MYVPVSHNNMLFKDGNMDISIERVDELHLHREQDSNPSNPGDSVATKSLPLSIGTKVQGQEVEEGVEVPVPGVHDDHEGAEVPVPDVHDDHGSYDSTVSLACLGTGMNYITS